MNDESRFNPAVRTIRHIKGWTIMALTEKITCDVCGIQKGEANHWMLWHSTDTLPGEVGGIHFAPWHQDLYRSYRHVCGESCAARLLARSIEEWRELHEATRLLPAIQHPQTLH